ncbi:hypothetical protein MXB_4515 [Myxobolus squamalis]|nr:hypothetical protein MXB_4515 [Myxobolus squamalis]
MISFVQCLSDKVSIWILNTLTYLKFLGMAFIIGLALYMLCRGETRNIRDWNFKAKITPMKLVCAFYPTMWTYDGFTQLIYFVKEIKNPTKNLVSASVIGIGLVTALYFLINFSYFVIIGVDGMNSFKGVAISIASPYIGKYSVILAILVSFSSLGSAFGLAYTSASDAAKNNNFPLIFSAIHSSTIPSNLEDFIWYFSGAAWIFYSLAIVAVVVLRFRKPGPRIFKVPLPIVVFLACVSISFVVLGFIDDWFKSFVSAFVIICSITFYLTFFFKGGVFIGMTIPWISMPVINAKIKKVNDTIINYFYLEIEMIHPLDE